MSNLWIRSQDKKIFRKINSIYYIKLLNGKNVIEDEVCNTFGEYKTKERCIKIIDEIQSLLVLNDKVVYEMPEK